MAKHSETNTLSDRMATLGLGSDFSSPSNRKNENDASPSIPSALSPAHASPTFSTRLWRPAAQRNLRNQWSKLASCKQQWQAASASGKSHANSLVNAYLSRLYMPLMELGALSDMPDIRKKAGKKLLNQQSLYTSKLLLSYKDMVSIAATMSCASRSMRCFIKSNSVTSSLVQFSASSEDPGDAGDGGGIQVYRFWPISSFEELADEIVQMFKREVILKRLLVLELLSMSGEAQPEYGLDWSDELYAGEFEDLRGSQIYYKDQLQSPSLRNEGYAMPSFPHKGKPNRETMMVYLTTWLAEVNIDTHRVKDILAMVGEEMHVDISEAA